MKEKSIAKQNIYYLQNTLRSISYSDDFKIEILLGSNRKHIFICTHSRDYLSSRFNSLVNSPFGAKY